MSENPATRDVLAALIDLTGIILILCAFDPFRAGIFLIGCMALVIGYLTAIYKVAAMSGAIIV